MNRMMLLRLLFALQLCGCSARCSGASCRPSKDHVMLQTAKSFGIRKTTPVSASQTRGGCKAVVGNNAGGTDDNCAQCADGYQWWPCNTDPAICDCGEGNTPTTAPPAPSTTAPPSTVSTTTAQPATTPPPLGGCVPTDAGRNGGATAENCALCATGHKWWPCNSQPALCACGTAPITSTTAAAVPTTTAATTTTTTTTTTAATTTTTAGATTTIGGTTPPASSGCTGNAALDSLLERANITEVAGLNAATSVYTWQGLCDAMRTAASVGYAMHTGEGQYAVAQAASNIASLLAQCKWESGLWTACDENWWNTASPQGACSQRPDNALYHDLTGPDACFVDPNMRMTAVTKASWAKEISCSPDGGDFPAGTRKCCWWGRGAIQTTGPTNYGLLNKNIVQKADLPELAGVDLCKDPEAMCKPQYPSLKWIGAIEYWVRVVQGFGEFKTDLNDFVNNGFVDASSIGFNNGAGAAVNQGWWGGHAHAQGDRQRIFEQIIDALKSAGMEGGEAGSIAAGGATGGGGGSSGNCCGSTWAASANGQECPGGTDGECPAGQRCYGGHTTCR